ncbi:hypothetical protein ACWIWA_03385 [Ursidibacter arcticus]
MNYQQTLVRSDNQNLANQLELAQSHIQQYQQQIEKIELKSWAECVEGYNRNLK